jgi:serine/threonine protein kinase
MLLVEKNMSFSTMKIKKLTKFESNSLPLLRNLKTNDVIEVARKKVIIGRHSGDDMTINDPKCSRGNTEVEFIDGKYFVRDRGSRNGTSLNGAPIVDTMPLNFGDKILIGATEIEFQKTPEKVTIDITGYEIIEHTASGGMGKVYKARQISLDRIVAIKVLAPKFTNNPRLTENFINEARSAGRLNHPNLVQVHDVNKDFQKNGQVVYYFTMEFIDGKTLKEMIRDTNKIPAFETIDLLIDITKGLEYIHANKLIHRDIKPDNIMIDREGNIKIADLGIALDENEATNSEQTTEDGQRRIVGTPHYISPEQVRGKGIDSRSDIYSLGATAYHMITGETPFEGGSSKEIIKKHITEEPRKIEDLSPDTPEIVCSLIKRMMSKKPDDRPQTVAALREELEQIKVKLEKGKSRTRLSKQKNRKTNALVQLSAILVGLFITAIYFYLFEIRSDNNKKQVIENPQPIDESIATIQASLKQAESFFNGRDYQKALEIYNSIKTEHPGHPILTDVDALIKKTNNEFEKEKLQKNLDDINKKFNEVISYKSQNPSEIAKILLKFEEFISKYPNSPEARNCRDEINKLKGDLDRLNEIEDLEKFKRLVESTPNDEAKLGLINSNKSRFNQKESKIWLAEKVADIKNKLDVTVANATRDAQSLDMNIDNEEFALASERAIKFLETYTYQKAKDVIKNKIPEIENKANQVKDKIIKDCQENLKVLNYSEILLTSEGKLYKLKKTKAFDELTLFIENVKTSRDFHEEISKVLDGKNAIAVNYQESEGPFDVEYSVVSFSGKAVTFRYSSPKEKEEQTKIITWVKLEKPKLYLIYESVLKSNNTYEDNKKKLAAFAQINGIADTEISTLRIR